MMSSVRVGIQFVCAVEKLRLSQHKHTQTLGILHTLNGPQMAWQRFSGH